MAKTPTEARQASSRTTNFRVLIISMVITVLVLGGFAIAFIRTTPAKMEGVPTDTAGEHVSQGSPPDAKPLSK
ncbi:MAG: hypothetical protein JSS54_14335 [Proteobacteria bacterium]|nr:hypothetical protein [Pseudomonadota bacterium]MBS0270137.1 hypothetical protein [Pseudomonadota bacterium]